MRQLFSHDEIRKLCGQFGNSRAGNEDVEGAWQQAGASPILTFVSE